MELTINNEFSFRAKLGKRLLKQINKEFKNEKVRTNKYVALFDDTFTRNIDKETVVDITKHNNLVFSNTNFPDVKYQHSSKIRTMYGIAKTLINECSRTISGGEIYLFKNIIRKYLNKGIDFSELEQMAEKIINTTSRERFLEKIKVAERIKKEFPETTFSNEEFDYMQNKIMQEEAEIPGTKIYELIHKSDFLFSFQK